MPDNVTTSSKSDLEAENARLRQLLADNNIDADAASDPNRGIVGNLADLQRLGSLAVAEGKTNVDEAVVRPASTDADSGDTIPAETAAGTPA